MLRIRISYTDGNVAEGFAEDWHTFRSDGVDAVRLADRVFHGHAIYWLYRAPGLDGGSWVFGMASTYVSPPPPEVLFRDNGTVVERKVVTMPDLFHHHVKLGWWRRLPDGEHYVPGFGNA